MKFLTDLVTNLSYMFIKIKFVIDGDHVTDFGDHVTDLEAFISFFPIIKVISWS